MRFAFAMLVIGRYGVARLGLKRLVIVGLGISVGDGEIVLARCESVRETQWEFIGRGRRERQRKRTMDVLAKLK